MTKDGAYLNLQDVLIAANSLVVHLMICIIRITAAFILNKGEPTSSVNDIRAGYKGGNNTTHRRLAAVRGAGMSHRTRRP